MIYIETGSTDVYYNFGLENYFATEKRLPDTVFLFWRTTPTLMVGKYQNILEEINKPYADAHGIHLVRRMSGGGTIYTDLGGWQFTFIEHSPEQQIEFAQYIGPVVDAVRELGADASFNGRNDLLIDGRKFSGNAQYRKRDRIMHHGTILYDSNLSMVSQALAVSRDKIESKGLKSVQSRVTNVKPYMTEDIPVERFVTALRDAMFRDYALQSYTLDAAQQAAVEKLQSEVYDTWDWNFGASPPYSICKERRVENCGKLEVHMDVEKGVIQRIAFFGDYFGDGDTAELGERLVGQKAERAALHEALATVNIGDYFHNLDLETFLDILTQ